MQKSTQLIRRAGGGFSSEGAAASADDARSTADDYRRLLQRRDIDAVCICTPSNRHAQVALDSIAAGKHVFVEEARSPPRFRMACASGLQPAKPASS